MKNRALGAATTFSLSSVPGDLLQTKLNERGYEAMTVPVPNIPSALSLAVNRSLLSDFSYLPIAAKNVAAVILTSRPARFPATDVLLLPETHQNFVHTKTGQTPAHQTTFSVISIVQPFQVTTD